MLKDLEGGTTDTDSVWTDAETELRWTIQERTLTILARLIMDSEFLQRPPLIAMPPKSSVIY